MSIKEEAIQLIDNMPDNEVVKVVAFIRGSHGKNANENRRSSAMKGLEVLQSFAGVIPSDLDTNELLNSHREEKYGSIA